MGAWGTALFSDDTACDVRDAYRDHVGDGLSGHEATNALLREWAEGLDDPDDAGVFWFALAATQWHCGRLEPRVMTRALELIDSGADLERWREDPKLRKKRQAALAKLRVQLLSPQPPEKRIPKRFRNTCEWGIGEVISYRLQWGRLALLRVIGFHTDAGGTSPVCEVLDWVGTEVPPERALRKLRVRDGQFMIGRLREGELPAERVSRLGITLRPAQEPGGYHCFLWRWLDRQLQDVYGIG